VPTDGAISPARGRLGDKPLKLLFDQSACPVGTPAMDGVFCRGRRLIAVDGTVFDLPRGKDNEAEYAIPGGGKLPQARVVALGRMRHPGPAGRRTRVPSPSANVPCSSGCCPGSGRACC
jgi:hypothetical protein